MPAGAKKEKAEIEKLHEYLAKPLEVHEALARESQHLAVQNLALLERQLKTISRGSVSLPGRSFNDLISAAGLSNVFRSIQSTADEIRVPKPDHNITPHPARRTYVAPPATTTVKTTQIQTTALPAKTYEEAPDHRQILIDPQPWRLAQISHKAASQRSITTQPSPPVQAPPAQVQPPPPVASKSTARRQHMNAAANRRTIVISLDPACERPEEREFKSQPLVEANQNRSKIVLAILTIMRAFVVAGSPRQAIPLGSFEEWSRRIRDPLIWLGQPDPCESMRSLQAADPERTNFGAVIQPWAALIGLTRAHSRGVQSPPELRSS